MAWRARYSYDAKLRVESHRVKRGTILWLPERPKVVRHFNARRTPTFGQPEPVRCSTNISANFEKDMYDHPILVVSRDRDHPEEIDFVLMTTLGSKGRNDPVTIDECVARLDPRRHAWELARLLPIDPSPKHPESGILLRHKYGTKPVKFGNVAFHGVYTMDWQHAQLYWNGPFKTKDLLWELDETSMSQVLTVAHRECQYMPQPQYVFDVEEATKAWELQNPRQIWRSEELSKTLDRTELMVDDVSDLDDVTMARRSEGSRRSFWSETWPQSVGQMTLTIDDLRRPLRSLRRRWLEALCWLLIIAVLGAPLLFGLLWIVQFLLSSVVACVNFTMAVARNCAVWEMDKVLNVSKSVFAITLEALWRGVPGRDS